MTIRARHLTPILLLLLLPVGSAAQQRIERFPESPSLSPAPVAVGDSTRGSYWLEGMVVGIAAGVIGGLLWIEDGGMCTTGVPAQCSSDGSKVIGTALTSIATGFLGIILGSTIERDVEESP